MVLFDKSIFYSMDSLEFEGSIEVAGKSLYFIIKETGSGREQVFPVVEVLASASPCLMYGRWELALGDFELGEEFEIINPKKVELQIEALLEQIEEHRRVGCNCKENLDTKYFRNLRIKREGGTYNITLRYFDNRSAGIRQIVVEQFSSEVQLLKAIQTLLEWGMRHKSFVGADILDLTAIDHDSTEVVIAIGEMFEDYYYGRKGEKDAKIKQLIDEIERLIPEAIEYQENNLP